MRARLFHIVILTAWISWMPAQEATNGKAAGDRDSRLTEPGQIAPLLEGLGDHHFPVTTQSVRAQVFIDQGLNLTYGFNHREAARAFREAARLDPECPMAYWGLALVHGPNLNLPMNEESGKTAYEAIQKARSLKKNAPQREQDYIEALAARYAEDPKAERAPLDQAYARAMKALTARYPKDLDAATLYAAALMNQSPWDYWWRDGRPYERTKEVLALLESVIERDSRHAGAHHYYIHAVEAEHPARAEASADILGGLMPGAGHILHMPAHIYMRIGRFQDAYEANVKAVAADESYIAQCKAQGIYPLGYYPHNIHFLWAAATHQGRGKEAIAAARKVASKVLPQALENAPSFQSFLVVPYYALTRFGRWDEILKEPEPDEKNLFARGIWHYARGNAFRARGDLDSARAEAKSVEELAEDEKMQDLTWNSPPGDLLTIAALCLNGEIAAKDGDYDEAIALLSAAVRLQDALRYNEPPDWHYPVRHSLGAVLIEADRPSEAEIVYWEDLRYNADNGWALFGLIESLRAQEKTARLADLEARLQRVWEHADVRLTSSRF